jgi:hypothetical protein
MKALFVSAILSFGFALTPMAFAQNASTAEIVSQRAATTAQTPQAAQPQWSGTPRANDTGYGMESSGTSNYSTAQATSHAALMAHEGRNDLFSHH